MPPRAPKTKEPTAEKPHCKVIMADGRLLPGCMLPPLAPAPPEPTRKMLLRASLFRRPNRRPYN